MADSKRRPPPKARTPKGSSSKDTQADPELGLIAPWPVVDRYPVVIGQNLTGQFLSSQYRLCTQGWRYGFVDLINELLEFDGHARGVVRYRVLAVAGGRVEVNPPKLPPNHPDERLANDIAENFDHEFSSIPARSQALGRLNWALVYGLGGSEIDWQRTDRWEIEGLSHIHSRRLNYPDPLSWDLYLFDQGLVGPGIEFGRTTGLRGLRIADYPGKFAIHTPALNGDYPTRDGEARYIGIYLLLKRMVMRATAQDFERVIKPWVIGYFSRQNPKGSQGDKSFANKEDIAALENAIKLLAAGSLNGAVLSDSCKIELLRAAAAMDAGQFLSFLNSEISKAVLGQSFTTEPGPNGNFATATTAEKMTLKICQYDAGCCADTIRRDIATPWMLLNYPQANRRLAPIITIHVDELPDAKTIMEVAAKGASIDMPIDVDELAKDTSLKLCPPEKGEETPRRTRMVAAGKAEAPPPPGADPAELTGPTGEPVETEEPRAEARPNGKAKAKPNGKADGKPRAPEGSTQSRGNPDA